MDDDICFLNAVIPLECKEEENSCKKFKHDEKEDCDWKINDKEDSCKKLKEDSGRKFREKKDSDGNLKEKEDSGWEFKEKRDNSEQFREKRDSDVKLKEKEDSGVKLNGKEDSDVMLNGKEDYVVNLKGKEDSFVKLKEKEDSFVRLEEKEDSVKLKEKEDSGVELKQKNDNVVEFKEKEDSGLELKQKNDNGVELKQKNDNGVEFKEKKDSLKLKEDSGVELKQKNDNGVEFKEKDDSGMDFKEKDDNYIELKEKEDSIVTLQENEDSDGNLSEKRNYYGMFKEREDSSSGGEDNNDSSTSNSSIKSNTPNSAIIRCNIHDSSTKRSNSPSYPILRQTWTYTGSTDLQDHYNRLTNAYKYKYFNYVFKQLERNNLIILMNKKLTKFFIKELKNKKSLSVIRALHALHSLILNPLSIPQTIVSTLACDNFLSCLFDPEYYYNSSSFSFLTKEILNDILSELFCRVPREEWESAFLTVLNDLCHKYFYVTEGPPSVYFHIITACLIVGIEALPEQFYASLKHYFNYMLKTVSRNKLSSHYISKVWDKLMLFCHHWVKYVFTYSHLPSNPSCSKREFRDCVSPDFSILKSRYVRDRLKYEFIHVEDGYVPCEFPLVPSSQKFFKTSLPLGPDNCYQFCGNGIKNLIGDFIGTGHCSECHGNDCSCLEDYIELYEASKKQELSSESSMELDEMQDVCFDPSDGTDDMSPEEMAYYYDSLCSYEISYSF